MRRPLPQLPVANYDVNVLRHLRDRVEVIWRAFIPPKWRLLQQMVTFCAFVAPPMDENGIAFGPLLKGSTKTCDSNLGWIRHFLQQIVTFCALVAPPVVENGIAFGCLLKPSP